MIEHEIIPLFGQQWWVGNAPTVVVVFLFLILGKKMNVVWLHKTTFILGGFLLSVAILSHPYQLALGRWSLQSSLPLQMCAISALLSGLLLLFKRQWMYEIVYFWGIPGAFHSLMTPEFTLGTDGLFFIEYFVSHGGIILSALWVTLLYKMKPRKGSWWKIFLWSQLLLPIVGSLNWLLDANYMYLCAPPSVENPFLVGEFPYHLIGLELAGLLHFAIVYLPFGIQYRKKNN